MKALALIITGLVVTGNAVVAQSSAKWPPPAGIQVRVESPVLGADKHRGTLVSATADTIVMRTVQLNNPIAVPTGAVTRMEVATGTHTRRLKGMLIGLAVAGGTGFAIAAATWHQPKPCMFCIDFGRYGDAAFVGSFSGILGALGGFIAGSFATETWQAVDVPRRD
jgi:hypothetical protein